MLAGVEPVHQRWDWEVVPAVSMLSFDNPGFRKMATRACLADPLMRERLKQEAICRHMGMLNRLWYRGQWTPEIDAAHWQQIREYFDEGGWRYD